MGAAEVTMKDKRSDRLDLHHFNTSVFFLFPSGALLFALFDIHGLSIFSMEQRAVCLEPHL